MHKIKKRKKILKIFIRINIPKKMMEPTNESPLAETEKECEELKKQVIII